jgi:MYXO-CTERM domain-containing protein
MPASAAVMNKRGAARSIQLFLALLAGSSAEVHAEVLFQNTGNKLGWGRVFTQKAGTITEVTSPVYKGTTAVKTTQTYQSSDGKNYHSEIIKEKAHLAGQDLYYGHAVYLPADWVFHGQNVTFQQWAPEQPEAPWILMYLQGDRVRLGGRGANGDKDAGRVTGLRGTWIRFVTRIHMATDGAFEVWINGEKTFSQRGNFRAHGPSMRWSNGIYCTRWDTETPTGPRELTFWHDNMRIATTYAEADPATWGDGDPGPTGEPADGGTGDAAVADAGGNSGGSGGDAAAGAGGAGGAGSGGATGGGFGGESGSGGAAAGGAEGAGSGGRSAGGSGSGGAPKGTDGAGGSSARPSEGEPSSGAGAGGCRFGGTGSDGSGAGVIVLFAAWLLRRRRRSR